MIGAPNNFIFLLIIISHLIKNNNRYSDVVGEPHPKKTP